MFRSPTDESEDALIEVSKLQRWAMACAVAGESALAEELKREAEAMERDVMKDAA